MIDATSSESNLENETGVRMVALFDHEEVGSNSAQGAGSPAMLNALSRITSSFDPDSKVINAPHPSDDSGFRVKKEMFIVILLHTFGDLFYSGDSCVFIEFDLIPVAWERDSEELPCMC